MVSQAPPPLPGFEPVENVVDLSPQPRAQRRVKPAEERAQPQDDTTTALVQAVDKVYRVVTAQIAYHEAEARRLREALKPFAGIPAAAAEPLAAGDALQELLNIAKKLPIEGS